MSGIKQKNTKIELLRFVFCIYVIGFHLNKYLIGKIDLSNGVKLDFFPHGAMAVEFFFFLSGALMAMSVYNSNLKNPEKKNSFEPSDGLAFLKRKFSSIFPYHFIAFAIAFISLLLRENINSPFGILMKAVESIPSFFLIMMSGINYASPNHVEWYISCMLIAMAIIYPLLRKNYDLYAKYAGPILSILMLGYLQETCGKITGVGVWMGLCYRSLLRAFVDLSLGVTAFEVSRYLKDRELDKSQKFKWTIAEWICFLATTGFVMFTFEAKYEILSMIAIWGLLVLSLSGQTFSIQASGWKKLCGFLGKFSLPLYLAQVAGINLTLRFFSDRSLKFQFVIVSVLILAFSLIIMVIGDWYRQHRGRF